MRTVWMGMVAAAGVGVGSAASAHELACEVSVEGGPVASVARYPATVTYGYRVLNQLAQHASVIRSAEDPALAPTGWSWPDSLDRTLAGGESVSFTHRLTLDSFAACRALAEASGTPEAATRTPGAATLDNAFRITWEGGEAQCSARLLCTPESPPPPPPPPPGVATRTLGFYKTHPTAVQRCLEAHGGSVALGSLLIDAQADALGLLWGSPARDGDGEKRSRLDQARFLLARQALVGRCNQALFHTPTDPGDLLEQAGEALTGGDCQALSDLADALSAYNDSGTGEPLPAGFDAGSTDPKTARELADDPTSATGAACSDA